MLRPSHVRTLPALFGLAAVSALACGSPPPAANSAPLPVPTTTQSSEKQPDISPVAEPPGLVAVARVEKPEAVLAAAGGWTHLPIPNGAELLRSITEDSIAEVIDLSQPVDAAAAMALSRHGIDQLLAFSVAVKSFDQAKSRLGAQHRLEPGSNGDFRIVGLGTRSGPPSRDPRHPHADAEAQDDDDGDDGLPCVLAHAAFGARLVCGNAASLEALAPYLTRTLPREKWSKAVHVEIRPDPLRAPLQGLRAAIPGMGQALFGTTSPAVSDLLNASVGEAFDLLGDTQRLQIDASVADSGLVLDATLELRAKNSTIGKILASSGRPEAPPAAFFHLPAETDVAFFGNGSDPKLFDRPRELIANVLVEAAESGGMPASERQALKDLVGDRMLSIFTNGPGLYAKGYDQAGVERALRARQAVKPTDVPGLSEAKRVLLEQAVGWHLVRVGEPLAKVAPMLRDWSALWNRPAFAKWARSKVSDGSLPQLRLAPGPAGVTLPPGTVHLEIAVPRDDVELESARGNQRGPSKPKMFHRKPVMVHLFAIPDGSATWLAFGMDGKLAAEKALASLSSGPDKTTLRSAAAGKDLVAAGPMTSGGFVTLRGLAVLTAMEAYEEGSPFTLLGTLPSKGAVPLVLSSAPNPPSASAPAGASVVTVRIPRGIIEDTAKLIMQAH
jgi:hypothetical protein